MTQRCPQCDQELSAIELQQGVCASCGHRLGSMGPASFCVVDGVDMRLVARRQRWLLWLVVVAFATPLIVVIVPGALRQPSLRLPMALVYLASNVIVMVGSVRMLVALRKPVVGTIFIALLLLAPCISLVMLLIVNQMATGALSRAGLKVGFMGVRDQDVIRKLNPFLCRQCGYNLIGNVTGRCPECGTELPRAAAMNVPRAVAVEREAE